MIKARVVHCKKEKYDVYIGRPGPWGNPFAIVAGLTREQSIEAFKTFLHGSHNPRAKWMREHIGELRGKTLGCWCTPLACHGDVLAAAADV